MKVAAPPMNEGFFLNVAKPRRLTSARVVAKIKRAGRFSRVGHAGTLDPLADGVLPIAVGRATRIIPYLHAYSKAYVAVVMFGLSTTTDDLEGEVLTTSPIFPSPGRIRSELTKMSGTRMQLPPAYSAVMVRGRRAYDLARSGIAPDVKERAVHIESARLISTDVWREGELIDAGLDWTVRDPPGDGRARMVAAIEIECSSGTYIRSIARELGKALETGACVAGLCRTRVGPFHLLDATSLEMTLHAIEHGYVRNIAHAPDEAALALDGLILGEVQRLKFLHGSAVDCGGRMGSARFYDRPGAFLGIGEIGRHGVAAPKVVVGSLEGLPA